MKLRSNQLEILDGPDISEKEITASLDFMVGVNQFLGGARAVIDYFERQPTPDEFTVVDLGSGSGDIDHALVQWGKKRGKRIHIKALDVQPYCLAYAKKRFSLPEIEFMNYSAFDFEALGDVDYVISSMFFHHLKDDVIVMLLKKMKAHCRRGFLINDLHRGWMPYVGVGLLAGMTFNRVVLNDATLSVARGFKVRDYEGYCEQAGVTGYVIRRKPMFRLMLEGANDIVEGTSRGARR